MCFIKVALIILLLGIITIECSAQKAVIQAATREKINDSNESLDGLLYLTNGLEYFDYRPL